ncbi:Myb-related protein Hv33 [Hordeum vulgare]|uniref:Uncharacterized protein n=1 Tax=Hordeum vulgare subsp. vulgare TaxID=112509 RepID=M0XN83_HORVV|nr:myb-related protein Hv33-like [Hordeum vulgare subsp. vulgare]KAE8787673.1 Myb-related protein Hv33 [Hordeum vulgare]KAI5001191.1 hypothetical protein ZWY2020_011150 [Hordeum vulgare]
MRAMGREAAAAACSSNKPKLRRGLWSPEEDEKLYNHIIRYGVGCWSSVPRLAGLERCGKSCRLRWINYLRPDLKRGSFSQQEEDLIVSLHKIIGNRWSQIASQLPGRTDNEIKNFWNSCIKKKLRQLSIDSTTHKPLNDAVAVAEPHDDCKQLVPGAEDRCFGGSGSGSDDLLAPHSPVDCSFDPTSVTNVPTITMHMQDAYSLCDYGATTYSAYTGGGGSSSNGTWTCGNGNVEPLPHMDMFRDAAEPYPFDPSKFSQWQQQQAPDDHRGSTVFPIRSLSRDLPESCFELARGALEDEFDFM